MNVLNKSCHTSEKLLTITGKVLDANTHELLPFANIYLSSNNEKGTAANENGEFTIEVPYRTTLTASYVGYHPQEFVANNEFSKVLLEPDNELPAVVITHKKKRYGWLWALLIGGAVIAAVSEGDEKPTQTKKQPLKVDI